MTPIGTRLLTWLHGRRVGADDTGNIYYEEKRDPTPGRRRRRWVIYNGAAEATKIPPEWHAWMHFLTDQPLPPSARRPWQKPYLMNATGTAAGYRPPGHDYRGGHRAHASSDYEAWTPGS